MCIRDRVITNKDSQPLSEKYKRRYSILWQETILTTDVYKRQMKGFIQVLQVLLFFVGGIVIIAIIVNKSCLLYTSSLKKRTLLVLLSGLTATFTLAQQQPVPEWQSQYAVGLNKLAPHTYVWPCLLYTSNVWMWMKMVS